MSPFITYKDTDSEGFIQYYILQRNWPHYLGVISYYPDGEAICQVPITGHHLYIKFNGVLRGNYLPSGSKVEEEIEAVFHAMALWFYANRIEKDPSRYKKWAIRQTS